MRTQENKLSHILLMECQLLCFSDLYIYIYNIFIYIYNIFLYISGHLLFFYLNYSIDSFKNIFHFRHCIVHLCLFFSSSRSLLNISLIFLILAPILFLRSWIIFTIITLNSFSGRLPISTSLSCSSGVLLCQLIWNTFHCCSILSNFLWLGFLFHGLQDCNSSCLCSVPSGGWG